jgi:hypothetical protein
MNYQAIHAEEYKHHIRDLHREAERRAIATGSYQDVADAGLRYIKQLHHFVGAIVLFMIALAFGATALVLEEVGDWVYPVLAIWAIILVSRAIKLLAPEFRAQPLSTGSAA